MKIQSVKKAREEKRTFSQWWSSNVLGLLFKAFLQPSPKPLCTWQYLFKFLMALDKIILLLPPPGLFPSLFLWKHPTNLMILTAWGWIFESCCSWLKSSLARSVPKLEQTCGIQQLEWRTLCQFHGHLSISVLLQKISRLPVAGGTSSSIPGIHIFVWSDTLYIVCHKTRGGEMGFFFRSVAEILMQMQPLSGIKSITSKAMVVSCTLLQITAIFWYPKLYPDLMTVA